MRQQPEEVSVWKKEISLRRKPRTTNDEIEPARPEATSIWKKEISLRRKPDPAEHEATRVAPDEPALPAVEAELSSAPSLPSVEADDSIVIPPVSPPMVSQVNPSEDAVVVPPVTPPVSPAALPPLDEPGSEPGPVDPTVEMETPQAASPPYEPEASPTEVLPGRESAPGSSRFAGLRERLSRERVGGEPSDRAKQPKTGEGEADRQHKRVVGLKIGASQVAAAEIVNNGGHRLVRMARMPLPRGIVVGGELREPEELATVLRTFFRQNKLRRTGVRLGVSNNRIGVRTFEISGIEDEKQLANAIRFRAQEALPIPLDEAVLDYRVLDERLDEDGTRVRRVLLVVAHRELIERYAAACRHAGLKLIGIDLEAFALLRALASPTRPTPDDSAIVCISIGADRSTLAVSDGRVCEFTRVLSWGGSAFDVALARVLDISPSEAEQIKHQLSLDGEGEEGGVDAERAEAARRAMSVELQVFAREIVASLRFYQEQPGSLGISEILITGGTAASGGLAPELERLIGLPVRLADPLVRLSVSNKVRQGQSARNNGSLAVAIGLGIED